MYLLRISDGTTQVILTGDSPILGVTYFPTAGTEADETVAETAVVYLEGTESAIRSKLNTVKQLLYDAEHRDELLTPRVYLEKRETSTSTIYRTQLKGGEVQWSQIAGRHRLGSTLNAVEVAVIFTRLNYWEGSGEVELNLSTSTQAATTGGVDVYNNSNASGNQNFMGLAGSEVVGDLPAPIRLRILNNAGTTLSFRNFLISNNVFSAPGTMDPWLVSGDSIGGDSTTWSAGVDHTAFRYIFPLSATLLDQTKGRYFRVVACFNSLSSPANWRAGIYSDVGGLYIPLRTTRELNNSLGFEMLDLGALPFPPGGNDVNTGSASLIITVRSTVGGSASLSWVQLMATDSFRRLEQLGYSIGVNGGPEDDGILGSVYSVSGSTKYPIMKGYYNPIKVWPNRAQQLTILFDEGTSFVIGRKLKVSAWYRPRVRSL